MRDLVLWGHHLQDYQEMFDLGPDDLKGRLLEFGCGPSAFNSEVRKLAAECVSCDPMFALDIDTLKTKTMMVFDDRVSRVATLAKYYDFSRYHGFDGLVAQRRAGMDEFFADYQSGKQEGRYVAASELQLPFPDFYFDFALCSHYLFGDLDLQDLDFHISMIKELARIAKEVRIFPLVDGHEQPSSMLGPVMLDLQMDNYGVEVRSVKYHLQPKGNAMLRVWAQECRL